jgi:predicted P-loop ATPase
VVPFRSAVVPPQAPDEDEHWRARLILNEDSRIKPKLATNWYWMLRGHADTRGMFAWNDVMQTVYVMKQPPWQDGAFMPRALVDNDQFRCVTWLEGHGLTPRKADARDTIRSVAQLRRFNPVRDYLSGLEWDGCPRLAGGAWESDTVEPLSVEYLGAPPDQIYATMVLKWHVAAVARILRPGCKVDTMIVFESSQGKMKSSYLRVMSMIDGHEYFADSIGDIANPSSIMLLQGTWIVEISELAGFDRKEVAHIKAWLSRTTDRFVPKYESEPREVPRHYAVAGTHNPSGHGYLKDPTGARRFWPVPTGVIDLSRVRRDRDQIWAEAVALFRAGQKWWLTADEQTMCDALTGDRRAEEPWAARIDEMARPATVLRLQEVMQGLSIPAAQQNELTVKRISEHLRWRGWHREARGDAGERVWVRAAELQEELRV